MRTFIILMTALLAFGITSLMGFWLIPLLRKVKYGQTILDIGPVWHKKQAGNSYDGRLFVYCRSAGGGYHRISGYMKRRRR